MNQSAVKSDHNIEYKNWLRDQITTILLLYFLNQFLCMCAYVCVYVCMYDVVYHFRASATFLK